MRNHRQPLSDGTGGGTAMPAGAVVVGVDGSAHALSAVRWAAEEAALQHAPLHLVHAIGTGWDLGPRLGVVSLRNQAYHDEGAAALAAAELVARRTAEPGTLDVSIDLAWPAPAPVLAKKSRTARRLVVGSRGMDAFDRALLGSVSSALVRRSVCPIVVIPAADPPSRDRPVVVGVDGSAASVRAVEVAFEEAATRDVEVVAVLAWTAPGTGAADLETAEHAQAVLSECLAGHAEKYPQVRVRRVVAEDAPARRLLQESENAQLVVVGSRGRRGLAEFTLGSVSRAVLDHATVPVLVARQHS
ncbi:universal stress protein [Nocardia halotolerans]|uniref:Universal stress protein n=1 Tax=Nocardia halotolerans TaxID=1755878 RepID=A0ABV8VJB5_9NOCA